jgi:uncharacterized phage protein (TIGR02218 family)
MRAISDEMQARLDAEATTFCHCWKLTRRDGARLGFTDHDEDIAIDGLTYAAGAGLEETQEDARLGLAPGSARLAGALSAEALEADDLANGLYDGASVEIWLVDWRDPAVRMLLDVGALGAVQRGDLGFLAEWRSLAHQLEQERGRRFQRGCSADLGDAQCGVSLDAPGLRVAGALLAGSPPSSCLLAADGFADGWFTGGALVVRSGANAGARLQIKAHVAEGRGARLEFWSPAAQPFAAGDFVEATAGCDKSFATCGAKFANAANFRGFPHIPGNDALMRYPNRTDPAMDGGSLFR